MIKHTNNIKDMIDKSGLKQTHIADSLGLEGLCVSLYAGIWLNCLTVGCVTYTQTLASIKTPINISIVL